jgi:maltooligosyltrehalose trehalohydrolase
LSVHTISPVRRPLGAVPLDSGLVEFRVWAPRARAVAVRVRGEPELHELTPASGGVFAAEVPAAPDDDYVFVLDGERELPDPCSRFQPAGVLGPSRVVDTGAFTWTDASWQGVALEDLVLYELHVGTFTPEGTFAAAAERLQGLADLGVTAVELMPVATFPGNRGWGYDGVYAYAPHRAYGGPDGLAAFVDAAHAAGLAVVLDVVYNHLGPGGDRIDAFGPYLSDRHETGWGKGMNYDGPGCEGVREWAIQNALLWVRDYHVDGLRLDATHAVLDDSRTHVLAELAERVRDASPRALVTSEMETGDPRPIAEWGHDAQWADEFHHELHVLLTAEQEGYYGAYRGSVADLAQQFHRAPAERLIYCSQNHDQVGNRALGDRPRDAELALRAACLLFAPQTPLLFMGEEHGERAPFQFFTDHVDPFFAEATREGRKKEFEEFTAFSGEDVPDPQDPATFERSKVTWRGDDDLRSLYRRLLALRPRLPREVETEVDESARVLRVRRGGCELVADFRQLTVELRER